MRSTTQAFLALLLCFGCSCMTCQQCVCVSRDVLDTRCQSEHLLDRLTPTKAKLSPEVAISRHSLLHIMRHVHNADGMADAARTTSSYRAGPLQTPQTQQKQRQSIALSKQASLLSTKPFSTKYVDRLPRPVGARDSHISLLGNHCLPGSRAECQRGVGEEAKHRSALQSACAIDPRRQALQMVSDSHAAVRAGGRPQPPRKSVPDRDDAIRARLCPARSPVVVALLSVIAFRCCTRPLALRGTS